MPLYEYVCESCGEACELLVRSDERPACPACGEKKLARTLSTFSAHAKSAAPACGDGSCRAAPSCPGGGCPFA
jgi:putative FmdB family regulatory protein